MPYSIPGYTKILIYFGNSTISVYFSWHPLCLWICLPGRKGALFFRNIEMHNHQKDLNPPLWLYSGKVIVELENNIKNRKRLELIMALVIWPSSALKFLFVFDFKCLSNLFLIGDHQITFFMFVQICP